MRLRQLILESHDIDNGKEYHWTDSLTVTVVTVCPQERASFHVEQKWGNLGHSTADEWRHVKGTLNPADIGTRGMTASQLLETEWLTGPVLLRNPPETWPDLKAQEVPEEIETACLNQTLESVIDWTEFSAFRRILRVIAYCFGVRSAQSGLSKWKVPS